MTTELFEGLEPLPDNSNPCPMGGLHQSESFSNTISYFRRILYNEEVSLRAFEITEQVLQISSSFYQAWQYRKQLFLKLNLNLEDELEFLSKVALENPKNYQMWHYRKDLLQFCQNPSKELNFVEKVLDLDDRNVHAWGFRLWVVEKFALWEEDLAFIEGYLKEHPRNNSAWNYRNFVLKKCEGRDDLAFVFEFVEDLMNESCFNYLASVCNGDNCDRVKNKMIFVALEVGINVAILKVLRKCFFVKGKGCLARWCCLKMMEVDEVRREYWSDRANEQVEVQGELDQKDLEFCKYFEIEIR